MEKHYPLISKVTLKMLRYFYEVSQTRHFTKAATNLNITNSPLSHQIKELELALDVQLFIRNSRNVELTAAGLTLQLECSQMFNFLERSLSKVERVGRQQNNTLKIGLISSAFLAGLGEMLTAFHRQYPEHNIDIIELCPETQKRQLRDKKIDIGLVRYADTLNVHPLTSAPVTTENFIVAVANNHPLKDRKLIAIAELKQQDFCFISRTKSASTNMFVNACVALGFTPYIDKEFIEPNTLMAYVANSQAITIVPSSFSNHQWKGIRFIKLKENIPAGLCLLYSPEKTRPISLDFINTLKQHKCR